MIKWDIKIGKGESEDTAEKWGLIPLSISNEMAAVMKQADKSAYAEQSGEHTDTRTVADAFDVKVRFCAIAKSTEHVNSLISAFNAAVFVKRQGTQHIYDKQKIWLTDTYKHRVLTGYVEQPLGTSTEEWFKVGDEEVAIMELTLRVSNPDECSFDYHEGIGYYEIGKTFKIK